MSLDGASQTCVLLSQFFGCYCAMCVICQVIFHRFTCRIVLQCVFMSMCVYVDICVFVCVCIRMCVCVCAFLHWAQRLLICLSLLFGSSLRWFQGFNWEGLRQGRLASPLKREVGSLATFDTNIHASVAMLPSKHMRHTFKYKYTCITSLVTFASKHISTQGPSYIANSFTNYTPARTLRSSDTGLLQVTRSSHKKIGDAAFVNYAPKLWNTLPINIREANTLDTFRRLFTKAFY